MQYAAAIGSRPCCSIFRIDGYSDIIKQRIQLSETIPVDIGPYTQRRGRAAARRVAVERRQLVDRGGQPLTAVFVDGEGRRSQYRDPAP